MTRFASVQASVAKPFFDAAPLPLNKLEQLAEEAGLSGALVSQPTGVMSLRAAELFMVRLDRHIKHPTYFLETVRRPSAILRGSVANIPLHRSLTGVEAVESVATAISSILYGARFITEREGHRIWLLRTAGTTDFTDHWPVQQYNIEVGLQSVRMVLQRSIQPKALRVSCHVPAASLPEDWQDLPLELSRRTIGVAFDVDDLMPDTGGVVVNGPGRRADAHSQEADIDALRDCLATYLSRTSVDTLSGRMARAFGMSHRTYRRHLKALGLSHRQLLSDARLAKAEALLADASIPITEVAFELGYAHSAAFTRFFKERTCKTPQEFRQTVS